MRIFLLPISTRRTLLYAHRLDAAGSPAAAAAAAAKETWAERIQSRAAKTWADWEKKDKGWQKMVVGYGNYALRRIPYEEWGLKSVPPLSQRRRVREEAGTDEAEVVFPGRLIPADRVRSVLHALSTEREALHKRRLVWCFVGMPVTIPVALIPLIPNIPFFYLVYRAWSHWRAFAGGRHLQFLLARGLLAPRPSALLDDVYAREPAPSPSADPATTAAAAGAGEPRNVDPRAPAGAQPEGEVLLLSQAGAARMAQLLDLPQLEVELERAIWQVETAVHRQNEEQEREKAAAAARAGAEAAEAAEETTRDEKKSQ